MAERKQTNDTGGVLILDIPVIHAGYVNLLKKYSNGEIQKLLLVGRDLRDTLQIPAEIRANPPELTQKMLAALDLPFEVDILNLGQIDKLPDTGLYTAHDTVSEKLQQMYFPNAAVTKETPFLRWDESNTTVDRPMNIEEETKDPVHREMMKKAHELSQDSSDWWRRVGVVIARDGEILVEAYNQSLPTDHKPYIDGNPRDHVQAGTLAFLVSTVHGEQSAIAKAARSGIALDGSDLYLNSFPCPPCATSMGVAGVKRCFFAGSNAYLDAAEVLKTIGIETIFVNEKN